MGLVYSNNINRTHEEHNDTSTDDDPPKSQPERLLTSRLFIKVT